LGGFEHDPLRALPRTAREAMPANMPASLGPACSFGVGRVPAKQLATWDFAARMPGTCEACSLGGHPHTRCGGARCLQNSAKHLPDGGWEGRSMMNRHGTPGVLLHTNKSLPGSGRSERPYREGFMRRCISSSTISYRLQFLPLYVNPPPE